MLTTLRIKNFALVDELTLELSPGYNVITGETGAGKSILIGALTLVLGERADRTLIRDGTDVCSVEAVFDVSGLRAPLREFLEENGLDACQDGQLILKRSVTAAGTNRQFVNGSPTALSTLAAVGEWLVDIHGPHDHQSLLQPARQLAILDAFGKLEAEVDAYAALLRARQGLQEQKAALIVDEKSYLQQLELLRFQASEIRDARLEAAEDEQLNQEYSRASNSARLLQLSQVALEVLSENETSLVNQAGVLGRTLQELVRLDSAAADFVQTHEQCVSILHELRKALDDYAETVELDPARMQQLSDRLDVINSLKRKYGPSLTQVVAFGEEASQKVASIEQHDAELGRIDSELSRLEGELWQAGRALSARRRKLLPLLGQAVREHLADLGFKQSRFEVSLASLDEAEFKQQLARPSFQGLDTVEFLFAPNAGEPSGALRTIASSGELARVMLAIKTVLAAEDQVPVLVFDEVDANVGGETANAVGEKMRRIAQKRQVLCITHLPQVAATASAHFLASKTVRAGRTYSKISLLDLEDRITELARMLGGQTTTARKHAQALLGNG
jgi:DNA repair protein RecN (Recombination protein N)